MFQEFLQRLPAYELLYYCHEQCHSIKDDRWSPFRHLRTDRKIMCFFVCDWQPVICHMNWCRNILTRLKRPRVKDSVVKWDLIYLEIIHFKRSNLDPRISNLFFSIFPHRWKVLDFFFRLNWLHRPLHAHSSRVLSALVRLFGETIPHKFYDLVTLELPEFFEYPFLYMEDLFDGFRGNFELMFSSRDLISAPMPPGEWNKLHNRVISVSLKNGCSSMWDKYINLPGATMETHLSLTGYAKSWACIHTAGIFTEILLYSVSCSDFACLAGIVWFCLHPERRMFWNTKKSLWIRTWPHPLQFDMPWFGLSRSRTGSVAITAKLIVVSLSSFRTEQIPWALSQIIPEIFPLSARLPGLVNVPKKSPKISSKMSTKPRAERAYPARRLQHTEPFIVRPFLAVNQTGICLVYFLDFLLILLSGFLSGYI